MRYTICDIGGKHLLTTDGCWMPLPISDIRDALAHDLISFGTLAEAERFCRENVATGNHCRVYGSRPGEPVCL